LLITLRKCRFIANSSQLKLFKAGGTGAIT
jgi:hypothetical protein